MSRKILIFIYLAGACLLGAATPFLGGDWAWGAFSALYMLGLGAVLLMIELYVRRTEQREADLKQWLHSMEPEHDDEQDTDVPGGVLLDLDDILRTGRN